VEHATVTPEELLDGLLDEATDEELDVLQALVQRARPDA
jgi:hypothetical protein